ncbi:MAG: hypothetical protein LM590_10130 [Thermofilum sp.]|nr:hypothetical protein [Thermofilum sp.]
MGALTLSAAFALGFLYGRRAKAVEVQVPPKIVYLPVSRVEDYASSSTSDLPLPALPAPVLDEVLRKAEELYVLLKEREDCVWALSQASKLLNEKRISPATYREVTWRHMRRLAELSERVEKLSDELREAVKKASLEARKTAEAQAAARIGSSTV